MTVSIAIAPASLVRNIMTFVSVKNIKGTSFVGVKGYTNAKGEVSDQTFNVGIDYVKAMQNDLKKLLAVDYRKIATTLTKAEQESAYNEVIASFTKRLADEKTREALLAKGDSTIVRSEAQKDAYEHIAKGLKVQGNDLYIYGFVVRKKVIKPGVYKTVNSREKTIFKDKIEKAAKLQTDNYRQFKVGNIAELNIKGLSI